MANSKDNYLDNLPFSSLQLNRESGRREDSDYIDGLLALDDTQIVLFQTSRPFLATDSNGIYRIVYLSAKSVLEALKPKTEVIYAGLDPKGRAIFLASLPINFSLEQSPLRGLGEFADLRAIMVRVAQEDLSLLGLGRSLFDWHLRHGFCANCGTKTTVQRAGWIRKCSDCSTDHFPRTDPVAIMLVLHEGKCLLGRSKNFPQGFFSILAGFIEPGETMEEGCAREVFEEVGIEIEDCKILANQPWPYPSQLMIGMAANAKSSELNIDPEELAEAHWFTRDEVRALFSKDGLEFNGVTCFGPRHTAIAHYLLQYWLNEL